MEVTLSRIFLNFILALKCSLSVNYASEHLILERDVIYTSRAYATMSVSVCLSVRLSVCL